jgi:hypothetical protein
MEAFKKKEMIEIEYWSCGVEGHRHRSETAAKNCILVNERPHIEEPKIRNRKKINAFLLNLSGKTYKEIVIILGVCTGTAASYVNHIFRVLSHKHWRRTREHIDNYIPIGKYESFWKLQVRLLKREWKIN